MAADPSPLDARRLAGSPLIAAILGAAALLPLGLALGAPQAAALACLGALFGVVMSRAGHFHHVGLALAVPIALLPDFLFGDPSVSRAALCLLLSGVVAGVGAFAGPRFERLPWGRVLTGAMLAAFVAFGALSVLKYAHFGDILARDSAYYDQIFRSALAGEGWKGSILQSLLHDPPLESHWAIHFTPVAWLMLPFYALWPSLDTLLVMRNAFIVLACWPMYLIAQRHLGGGPAFALSLGLLVSPTMLYQPLNSFYFYGAGVAPMLWAWYFHESRRPVAFLLACGAMLMVREDMGIAVSALGACAMLDRWLDRRESGEPLGWPPWPYVAALMAGGAWWIGVVKLVMPRYGSASGAATQSWYAGWGSTAPEMLKRLLTDPVYAASIVLTRYKLGYLWAVARSTGFIGVAGIPAVVAAPYLAINLLVTRPYAATAEITYHYSLLIVAALYASLPRVLARWARVGDASGLARRRLTAAWLVLAMSLSSLTVVFSSEQLQVLRGKDEVAVIERVLAQIPEDGRSVAAPSRMLPALTGHKVLVASDKPMGYTTTRMDWVILAEGEGTFYLGDWSEGVWQAHFDDFRNSEEYTRVYAEGGYVVYRRR